MLQENYSPNLSLEHRWNKILVNQTQKSIKRIIHHDQVRFSPDTQGWFSIQKSINVIHHHQQTKKEKSHDLNRWRKSI